MADSFSDMEQFHEGGTVVEGGYSAAQARAVLADFFSYMYHNEGDDRLLRAYTIRPLDDIEDVCTIQTRGEMTAVIDGFVDWISQGDGDEAEEEIPE